MRTTTSLTLLLALAIPGISAAATGGPDAFGYTYIDSNSPGGPAYNWVTGGTDLPVPGDGSVPVTTPFPIVFYGQSYAQIEVGEDGILTFGAASPGPANSCLPTPGMPFVAPWWDDYDQDDSDQIRTVTTGSAPNRIFLVRWVQIDTEFDDGSVTFEVKFFEQATNGQTPIEVHYYDVYADWSNPANEGATGTVAIGSPTYGTLQYHCDTPSLQSGFAIRFEKTCNDVDYDGAWDCDGDCDDTDPAIGPQATEICQDGIDQDCSGADQGLDDDGDGFTAIACGGDDCDDTTTAVHPGVYDLCNSVDDNCDTFVDNGDQDGDGATVCLDCDDLDSTILPGAPELCSDSIDQDCDGLDREPDVDGDTFAATACGGNDCDDDDATIYPGAWDTCDLVDSDCNGVVDDGDQDGDGATACEDCADVNPAVHPGATETCADGIDQDCSGADDVADADADGYTNAVCGGNDCEDLDAEIHPGAAEPCDGMDNDCDGVADNEDADADGWSVCEDCAETNAAVNPGATDICGDGIDQDCSGLPDDLDGDGDGHLDPACGGDDCNDADGAVFPGNTEDCDGIDNDCDGKLDASDTLDTDGDGALDCDDCEPTEAAAAPGLAEDCADALDNDCDGIDDSTDPDCSGGDDDDDDTTTGDDDSAVIGDDDTTPPVDPVIEGDGCDCSATGETSASLLAAVLLLAIPRRRRR